MKNKVTVVLIILLLIVFVGLLVINKYIESPVVPISPTIPTSPKPTPVMPDQITARIGSKTASATGIAITPKEVVEDSRCPANVNCIWAGRVVVKAGVSFNGGAVQEYSLESDKGVQMPGGNVTLLAIEPAKISSGTINPSDYLFTFKIQR